MHCELHERRLVVHESKNLKVVQKYWWRNRTKNYARKPIFYRSSSTCSTESTISLTSSMVTPGIIRSASVNARWRALRATRASCVDTRGKSEAMAGSMTESSIVVSGNSSSSGTCPRPSRKIWLRDEYASSYCSS